MRENDDLHTGRSLLPSLNESIALISSRRKDFRAAERQYRERLKSAGYQPAEIAVFTGVLPIAAAATGDAATFLKKVEESGNSLIALDVAGDRTSRALNTFEKIWDALCRAVPKPERAALKNADATVRDAVQGTLSHMESAAKTREALLLEELLRIEDTGLDARGFLDRSLAPIARHFSAASAEMRIVEAASGKKARTAVEREAPAESHLAWLWSVPSSDGQWSLEIGFTEPTSLSPRDVRILTTMASHLAFVCTLLQREKRASERSLKVLQVEEMERRRISRELHDDPAQSLAVVRLHLEMIEGTLPEGAKEQVLEMRTLVEKTIRVVRRLISDLSPVVLQQLGPSAAIRQLVTRFRSTYPARVTLHLGKLPEDNHQFGLVVYRALQECFSNILRHSSAKNINVSVTTADRVLRLHVEDDGVGFQVSEGLSRQDCFGLIGIRERVALLGGQLTVSSTPKSGGKTNRRTRTGTQIQIELPLPDKNPS